MQRYHCIYHCLHDIPRNAPMGHLCLPVACLDDTHPCSHNSMQQSMTPLLLRAHKHQQAKPIVTLANWLQSSLIQDAIDRYERHPSTYRS